MISFVQSKYLWTIRDAFKMKMWEYGRIRSPQKVHFLDGIMVGKSGNG